MSLIYIICPGHSGSTLLDMLLGSHPEIFSTGELINLPNEYLNGQNAKSFTSEWLFVHLW